MSGCMQQLIDEQQRLYRLLDSSLNGTQYSVAGDVISPELPAVPPASANAGNAMRAHISRIWQLAENDVAGVTAGPGESIIGSPALPDNLSTRATIRALQGIINPNWFGGGNPATLADVIAALKIGSGSKKTSLLDKLSQILAAGGNIASIFSLIEGLLADTVDASEEGAVIGILIASTMAQAAVAGAQAQQIQRLINALDGGATPAPSTNVISELEAMNTKLV